MTWRQHDIRLSGPRIHADGGSAPGPTAISVVDRGFVVDPVDWDTPNRPHNPDQPRSGQRQNAFFGTPAQGVGMLASWGSGSITVRVCFGYLA